MDKEQPWMMHWWAWKALRNNHPAENACDGAHIETLDSTKNFFICSSCSHYLDSNMFGYGVETLCHVVGRRLRLKSGCVKTGAQHQNLCSITFFGSKRLLGLPSWSPLRTQLIVSCLGPCAIYGRKNRNWSKLVSGVGRSSLVCVGITATRPWIIGAGHRPLLSIN